MLTLIFATNNQHKVNEINAVADSAIKIITLKQASVDIEIPEPYDSLEENAIEKASVIKKITEKDCFSEDTGLFVNALLGKPGVKTARYAGENATAKENIEKLLFELKNFDDRSAYFKTVIALMIGNATHLFEGVCEGQISRQINGSGGFGYDPIFIPTGSDKCFAEMSMFEKEKFSHRKKAVKKLLAFLSELNNIT